MHHHSPYGVCCPILIHISLLFSLLCLFIYLYLNIIYKDLFISFFKKINNFTESFIKTYLKENNYSESISHLFLSYIVSVTPKGKILIDLKHFIGKKSLILTFYSILGMEVAQYAVNMNSGEIRLDRLRPGKYLMKYTLSDNTQKVTQIVKQ